MTRSLALALGAVVAGSVCLACVVPQGNPAGNEESPGGTACSQAVPCSSYQSCPQNDTCVSNACGWTACVTNGTVNMPCYGFVNGTCNTQTYTCSLGLPTGRNGVMAAVTFLKGNGISCGNCNPIGGGEE